MYKKISKLKSKRILAGLTQSEVAEQINISQKTISKYETKNRIPNIDNLIKLAEFFKCNISELIDLEENNGN